MLKRVLFVIPVLARSESDQRLLKRCLESIKRFDPGMLAHTLIVEEFASLGVRWCEEYGCSYIQKTGGPGYSASINTGIIFALEKVYSHVFTVNQDVEFIAPALAPLMRAFDYGDIVGGTLFYPTGKIQSAGWYYRDDLIPLEYEKYLYQLEAELWKKERFVGGITGALQGFSLSMRLPYDEGFSLSFEGVDFCVEALKRDFKIFYTPTISAVHVESATRGTFVGERELRSFKYYEKKHLGVVSALSLNSKVEAYNKDYERQQMG